MAGRTRRICRSRVGGVLVLLTHVLAPGPTTAAEADPLPAVPSTLRGTIVDATTGAPVPGAEVRLVMAATSRIADENGRFTFGDLEILGPDTIVVRHIRYDSVRLSFGDRDLGALDVELHLTQRPIELAGLEVEVRRTIARREATRFAETHHGRIWTREEFERWSWSAESAVDPLRAAPGVTQVVEGPQGYRCVLLRVRHGCAATYVDLMPVPTSHLVTLPTDAIDSFVILGPVEAQFLFGEAGQAGVVMIFTHR